MLRFSQIYCNNKKSKKQKQNANKNAQIHNTNTTKTRIANLHRYIFVIIRGGWKGKWNSHSVWVGQGLWSCLGIVELLVASVVILLLDETTSIPTWNWHTNNLFDSFNFTSKTEDKVNRPKTRNANIPKQTQLTSSPTPSWLVRPIKSLAPPKTFTTRAQKQRKSYLTARGQYNAFRKSNRSHRRQKTSLFTSDQVPFVVPII